MSSLRIGIVGCGRMGREHARAASRLGHQIAIACDVDAGRAAALAECYPGCEVVTQPAAVLWKAIDAGFVCTPPHARGSAELMAARAGVPIFVEKPIGLSADQCLPALALFRDSRTITCVGYMNRYRKSVQCARQLLLTRPVLGFTAHWVCAVYRVPWWSDPELSGGQLNEQCTHLIDLARYLVGEIVEVSAFSQPDAEGKTREAVVALLLRFENGVLGTVLSGCSANEKQIGCRIFTPGGQISLDGWDFKLSSTLVSGDEPGTVPASDVFFEESSAFLGAVQSGDVRTILSDLADATRTQRVVDAARVALKRGSRQSIPV